MSTSRTLVSNYAVCLWIPLFSLRAEERRRPELSGKPTAILSTTDTRKIGQTSSHARHAGVLPGMTVSQAIGLCPSLTILEADPVFYDEQFSNILQKLTSVSPVIEPSELGRVFIGVDGLDRLIGDPIAQTHMINQVVNELPRSARCKATPTRPTITHRTQREQNKRRWRRYDDVKRHVKSLAPAQEPSTWPVRLGWARGKFASWVAARRAKPGQPVVVPNEQLQAFIRVQPIATLPIDSSVHRKLHMLGIRSLGQLHKLPETAVISQFGRAGRIAWQLASCSYFEPVTGREHPEPIRASIDFPVPFADRLQLQYAAQRLVERALQHPRRRGWRVYTLRIRAVLEHGSSWLAEVVLKEPSADALKIIAPIKSKLEQSPPTGAVDQMVVEFVDFAPGTTELQLFARDSASAARAGRQRAIRWAAVEIRTRLKRSLLHHVIDIQPSSRIPERRYALIDLEV